MARKYIYAQENWKPKSPQNPAHRCSQQGHSQQPRAEISQTPVDWRPTHQWSSCTMECYSAIKRHKPLAYLPARTHLWLITRRARSPRKAPITRFHSEWSSLHWWEGSSEDSGVTWVSQGGVWDTRLPVRVNIMDLNSRSIRFAVQKFELRTVNKCSSLISEAPAEVFKGEAPHIHHLTLKLNKEHY